MCPQVDCTSNVERRPSKKGELIYELPGALKLGVKSDGSVLLVCNGPWKIAYCTAGGEEGRLELGADGLTDLRPNLGKGGRMFIVRNGKGVECGTLIALGKSAKGPGTLLKELKSRGCKTVIVIQS